MIDYAKWSPTGAKVAYVLKRDVYIRDVRSSTTERVTFDGGQEVFNGVADWVFEGSTPATPSKSWQKRYYSPLAVFGGLLRQHI